MKKASMACLIAGALALPMASFAQEDGTNTTNPKLQQTDPTRNRGSSSAMGDAGLTAKVKTQLIKDKDVSAMNVNVDTSNGVVTLTGTAKSRMEADKAARLARSVEGVKSVNNKLQVGMTGSSNTTKGSSTGAGGNAKNNLDSKNTPPKENRERTPGEISN